jgi:hypothetical protein
VETIDNSHIHIECGPLLALMMFGSSHIETAKVPEAPKQEATA